MAGFGGSTGVTLKQMQDAIAQSTAWSNNWLTNTSILAYAASVANPSFTTFRTSATSTDVPIANEYYIGTVERYGQNITVKMTTMQDASKMYINNSVNGGSTWTGWKTFLDSQSTASKLLTSTDDINSVNETGNYYALADSLPQNAPTTVNFALNVNMRNGYPVQIIVSNNNTMMYRVKYSSGWQPWYSVTASRLT